MDFGADGFEVTGLMGGGLTGGGTVRLAGGGATDGRYEIRAIGDTTVIVDGTFASPDSLVGSAYAGFGPAVFGGNGTIRGTFDGGNSRLSPGPLGNLPGRLTIGQALLGYSTVYHVDISGRDTASGYDQLVVLDRLALGTDPAGGGLDVLIDPSFLPSPGDRFTIIDDHFIGPVQGTFGGLAEGSTFLAHGTPLRISYVGGDGNDVVLKVVPEPGLLAAPPLFGLLLLLRRR